MSDMSKKPPCPSILRSALVGGLAAVLASVTGCALDDEPEFNSDSLAAKKQKVIDFWTPARVAKAVPRDFVFNSETGLFERAKPENPGNGNGGGGGGGGEETDSGVTGEPWTGTQVLADSTGKVLFQMGGGYYVCSASVVADPLADRSIVLTAGHCVYDEAANAYATNFIYIPNWDGATTSLSTDISFCNGTPHGCWVADNLHAHPDYQAENGFTATATHHDWGFAVVTSGTHSESVEDLGTHAIEFTDSLIDGSEIADAFGYPAEKKYTGNDLIYCELPVTSDPNNGNETYALNGCKLNGGASGGGWMRGFDSASGLGTAFSVNSYGYRGGPAAMYGPMFNPETEDTYNAALSAP